MADKIKVTGIYILQDPKQLLWIDCVIKHISFSTACGRCNNNWNHLIQAGLNANYMTRDRWFDIPVIRNQLKIDGMQIIKNLKISKEQALSWKLTKEEMLQLNLNLSDFSVEIKLRPDEFINEYVRLGNPTRDEALKKPYSVDVSTMILFRLHQPNEATLRMNWFSTVQNNRSNKKERSQMRLF